MERNTHERPSKADLTVNNKTSNGTAAKSSTVPVSSNGSSSSSNGRVKRKQWVLHDGPHGSLQRLRLRMAEEGCGHSQVALAKQFLSENSGESDQYAIHWLMKAADQGISEGLELLKTCFDTNRGINENNFHKIRSFLEMSQNERAARLGAKTLFSTMAQGSDFVTTKQLEQWLEESLAQHTSAAGSEDPLKMEAVDSSSLVVGGDLISEQHFTNAASIYSSGHFPPLLRLLDLGSKQKLTFLAQWLTHNMLNLFTHTLSLSVMFTTVIVFTVLSNSLPVLLNMQLSSLVMLLSWMLAVAAAVVCTAHTCRLVRDWNVFHGWSVLLSQHAQQLLEPAIPEQMYLARTLPPQLGRLLVSVVPCVVLQRSLISTLSLPFGELGVLACLICSASLDCRFTLGLDDLLCLIGWILWRMQSSPWKSFQDENDPETPISPPEVFQLSFFPAVSVRFHLTAVFGVIILVPLYMRRLRQFSNSTSLQFFAWSLAHFSSLIWLFLAIDWLQMSTYDGILRGLIVFVAALLLRSNCNWLTKANLMLCCVTSYSSGHSVGLTPLMALALAIFLIAAGRLGAQILDLTSQRHRLFEIINNSPFVRRPLLYLWTAIKSALLVACLAILTIRVVKYFEDHDLFAVDSSATINPSMPIGGRVLNDGDSLLDPVPSTISWERYRNYCAHPSPGGAAASIASTQLACSALNGVSVQWEGVVRQVSIESRSNWAEDILKWLPSKWAEWISCRIGEKWPSCHDNDHHSPQSFESKRCHLLWRINQQRGRHCHVDRFSKFTFVFEVEPNLPNATLLASLFDSKVTIMLMAGERFQSLGFRLAPGNAVRFKGILSSPSLGGLKPHLELTSLECLTCPSSDSSSFSNSHLPKETRYNDPEPQPTVASASWLASLATGALQGAADFVLPHFIRLNVTQLWSE